MDDCLKSLPSEAQAVEMVRDLSDVCHNGGFHLTKLITNTRGVFLSIPEEQRSKILHEFDLDRDQLPVEKALGLHWCVQTDVFKYSCLYHVRQGQSGTIKTSTIPWLELTAAVLAVGGDTILKAE